MVYVSPGESLPVDDSRHEGVQLGDRSHLQIGGLWSQTVFRIRIRIHRIHMFLGLLDPDPSVRGMDPDPVSDPI
jgi:hypothetical protein